MEVERYLIYLVRFICRYVILHVGMIEDSVDTFEKTRTVQIFLSDGAVFLRSL